MTGIVKGYSVKKNRDSDQQVLMLQVEVSGPDDTQDIEYMSHAGDDHIPPVDSIVTILQAGSSWKIAIASNDTQDFDSSLDEGERIVYNKTKSTTVKWKNDGSLEIETTNDVTVVGDVVADGISLKTHQHLGNLGYNTGPPLPSGGGSAPPTNQPTSDSSGDVISGSGTSLDNHVHSGVTSGGSNTGPPV